MKVGNLQMEEGAKITNLTAPSGTSFPENGNLAELFVLLPSKSLYMHDGNAWMLVATPSLPTLATVATSGSFDDLLDKPNTTDIPEGSNLYFTAQRAADAAPVQAVAGLSGSPSAAQLKSALAITTDDVSGTLAASRLIGLINLENIPAAAIERLIVVTDQAARYALTTATVQKGDTVKQTSDNTMWYVVDDANLGNASGYSEYTVGQASAVPWTGVVSKPAALQGTGTANQYIGADLVVRNLSSIPISTAAQAALDAKAPLDNPLFTTAVRTPKVNGSAPSGFRNKIINGCMRLNVRGNGQAFLGQNRLGADGIITIIGGFSTLHSSAILMCGQLPGLDPRSTSGGVHYIGLGTTPPTGSGYVVYANRIEAADAIQLGGKVITLSAILGAWVSAPGNHYLRIYRATAANDFSTPELVATTGSLGTLAINTYPTLSLTTTLTWEQCKFGLHVEVVAEYSSVQASSYLFVGDLQLRQSDRVEPFELRPIAIEENLRRRYLQKMPVWVNSSTGRTSLPINMFKTPAITGGGTGFNSTGTDKNSLICYQTTAGTVTLTLDSEL